jgi:hypothetical protein
VSSLGSARNDTETVVAGDGIFSALEMSPTQEALAWATQSFSF